VTWGTFLFFLAIKGMSSSKHRGVKSLFNRYLVKTHKFDKEYGKLYNHLFENRQEGDYVDFAAAQWLVVP